MIALIQEKPVAEVTVQDVLDRASVGRSTFYLHYRDKDDLLLSQLEGFLEFMSTTLSAQRISLPGLAPVAEMFYHIGHQNKLLRTLADAGYLTISTSSRKATFERGSRATPRRIQALVELLRNRNSKYVPRPWQEACYLCCAGGSIMATRFRRKKWTTLFHRMVWSGIAGVTHVEIPLCLLPIRHLASRK